MGSRYGRNKKRRDREKIALLQAAVWSVNKQLVQKTMRAHDLESLIDNWDATIKQLLGRYSAFRLTLPSQETTDLPTEGFQRAVDVPLPSVEIGMHDYSSIESLSQWLVNFHVWLLDNKEDHARLRQLMRYRLIDPWGRTAFVMSYEIDGFNFRQAMSDKHFRDHLANQIADSMAHYSRRHANG